MTSAKAVPPELTDLPLWCTTGDIANAYFGRNDATTRAKVRRLCDDGHLPSLPINERGDRRIARDAAVDLYLSAQLPA